MPKLGVLAAVTALTGAFAVVMASAPRSEFRFQAAPARMVNVALTVGRPKTLPEKMARTGKGTQLITAVTKGKKNNSRDGVLTWWRRSGKHWIKVGSAPARFGVKGLSDNRLEGDGTTPTGLFRIPLAFGIDARPAATKLRWHHVDAGSWWDENSLSPLYNTWYENCPPTICWESATNPKHSSEHLADYQAQYQYGIFVGFNADKVKVHPPARPSGSGIFIHVNGKGYTAGCISVTKPTLVALLKWIDPAKLPRIVIGNSTSIYRF